MVKTNEKILVIDDELDFLENMVELFQLNGFEAISATNGYDGLQEIKNSNVDLIICDINMSAMSGFKFLEKLNTYNNKQTIPIIFLSSCFSDKDEKILKANGASACLLKGIRFSELLNFIQSKFPTCNRKKILDNHEVKEYKITC
jgi:DNA-binding response OmpR family regulator